MTGPTLKTRYLILERDHHMCQWDGCRELWPGDDYSLQHRWPRAMGGSRVPWVNMASNLVLVAGSGTTLCHGHMESHRTEAERRGFIVRKGVTIPADAPIDCFSHGLVLLADDGTFDTFNGPETAEWRAIERFTG